MTEERIHAIHKRFETVVKLEPVVESYRLLLKRIDT
jgi:hypothetical protein